MRDLRTTVVLVAAAVVVAALFAPWYALDFSGAARDAMTEGSRQMPGVLGEFARGLLSVLPDRIVANAWDIFEKTDIALLCCALGAGFAALLERFDVAALAGGAVAGITIVAMLDRPGPGGDIVQLQWGAWLALAAGAAIVAASRWGAGVAHSALPAAPTAPVAAPTAERPVAATVWPPVEKT
jgi:hypothetical protein